MTKEKLTVEELQAQLKHFTGTEQWHRLPLAGVMTDGVKFLCDNAQCYWLMDIIVSYLPRINWQFAVVHLTVYKETGQARVLIDNGFRKDQAGYQVFASQKILSTDFPFSEMKLYVENNVICLPSEH